MPTNLAIASPHSSPKGDAGRYTEGERGMDVGNTANATTARPPRHGWRSCRHVVDQRGASRYALVGFALAQRVSASLLPADSAGGASIRMARRAGGWSVGRCI